MTYAATMTDAPDPTAPTVYEASPLVIPGGKQFTLAGTRTSAMVAAAAYADDGERDRVIAEGRWTETFTTVAALPGVVLDKMMGTVEIVKREGVESMRINQAASVPILKSIVAPADIDRFVELINDPDRAVDIQTLWMVASDMVTALAGRPTGGSGA